MRKWLGFLAFLCACGESAPPVVPALEVIPAMYLADGTLREVHDGNVVDLDPDLPPSADFVLWVGAKVIQLREPKVNLTVSLKNGSMVVAQRSKMITFAVPKDQAMAPAVPVPLNITTVVDVPACPANKTANVEDQELILETQITEPSGRQGGASRIVVPACRRSNGKEQILCHKTCSHP